jgi:hypothetical protein
VQDRTLKKLEGAEETTSNHCQNHMFDRSLHLLASNIQDFRLPVTSSMALFVIGYNPSPYESAIGLGKKSQVSQNWWARRGKTGHTD